MKFWKHLSVTIEETLPDWRDNFLSYKDLKKQLKKIHPKDEIHHNNNDNSDDDVDGDGRPNKRPRLRDEEEKNEINGGDDDDDDVVVEKEVTDFVKLLEEEIEKFNGFFVDKEEEYVIRLEVLQDRVAEVKDSSEELTKVGREIVDFHGEMVLLENYSALNYTGLAKILKKYDKRTGALVRLPFIQKVLQQPFFRTDVLNRLVKECEGILDHLFSLKALSTSSKVTEDKEDPKDKGATEGKKERLIKLPEELAEIENMESMYSRAASSALRILKEIRSGSSTVSVFSLPPIQSKESEEEVWRKAPSVEKQPSS